MLYREIYRANNIEGNAERRQCNIDSLKRVNMADHIKVLKKTRRKKVGGEK